MLQTIKNLFFQKKLSRKDEIILEINARIHEYITNKHTEASAYNVYLDNFNEKELTFIENGAYYTFNKQSNCSNSTLNNLVSELNLFSLIR